MIKAEKQDKVIHLILPYPNATLNPNACKHFYMKAKIKSKAKAIGYELAKLDYGAFSNENRLELLLIVHRKDKRVYDLDNVLASAKSVLDGVFSGLGIDDSLVDKITIQRGEVDKINSRLELFIFEIKN